jgi:hypothetical protein
VDVKDALMPNVWLLVNARDDVNPRLHVSIGVPVKLWVSENTAVDVNWLDQEKLAELLKDLDLLKGLETEKVLVMEKGKVLEKVTV